MGLLVSGLLGNGIGVSGVAYLLRDEFTTDRAAGAVDGSAAEPGPGVREIGGNGSTDLSVASKNLIFAISGAYSHLKYDSLDRFSGMMLLARFVNMQHFRLVLNFSPSAGDPWGASDRALAMTNGAISVFDGSSSIVFAGHTALQPAKLAKIHRYIGAFYMSDTGSGWKIGFISSSFDAAPTARPSLAGLATVLSRNVDYIRVPTAIWLPTPIVSDGFGSTFGTTDGLGHAEGIAGGIGSGGGGIAWTQDIGTWTSSAGKAQASVLSGGVAVATVNAGNDDVFAMLDLTRSAGNVGMVLRYTDENNNVIVRHNGTNVQVVKTVAGTPTTLVDVAATYSAGATLAVSADATKFRVYYNNTFIGSEQTISDAALQGVNAVGLRTADTGNTFDNFRVWAKGTNGEYSILDNY